MEETQEEYQANALAIPDESRNLGVRQIEVEFQKHILDISSMKMMFRCMWCGWFIEEVSVKVRKGGKERTKTIQRVIIDKNARIMNERCADWINNSITPLIFQPAQTSNISEKMIWSMWRGKIKSMLWTLQDTVFKKDGIAIPGTGMYELNYERLPDIGTFLAQLYIVTSKAKDGFALMELVETIVTQHMTSSNADYIAQRRQKPAGFVERLAGLKK